MRKLTVLVDMDDTIENLLENWVWMLNKYHHTNVVASDIRSWNISSAFPGVPADEVYAPLSSAELWERVKPLPGAVRNLKRLIDDGHSVYVVTASNPMTIHIKLEKVLFRYFPFLKPNNVIVASKKQMIRGDVMVDDAPHNLEGGKYLHILIDNPHNHDYDAKANGIVRANGWDEIYEVIRKFSQTGGK